MWNELETNIHMPLVHVSMVVVSIVCLRDICFWKRTRKQANSIELHPLATLVCWNAMIQIVICDPHFHSMNICCFVMCTY